MNNKKLTVDYCVLESRAVLILCQEVDRYVVAFVPLDSVLDLS